MSFDKNIQTLYYILFFRNLIFAYVIERLFALERGMTVQLVVYTEIIYAITTVLLEIPSGALADKWGRKRLLVLGAVFACLEFILLIFAHGFWLFGLAAFIAGVSGSCTSGAWNALLYDSLLSCCRQDSFEQTLGRLRVVDYTAAFLACILGAFLARRHGFTLNYWLSTGSVAIAFLLTLQLIEPPKLCVGEPILRIGGIIRAAFAFFRTHHDVFWIVTHAALICACVNYLDEFWQVYLKEIRFPLVWFGVFSAVLMVARAPGALMAAFFLRRFTSRSLVIFSSSFVAAGLVWAAIIRSAWGIVGMAMVYFAVSLLEPVVSGYIHRRADPSARATIESVQSMVVRFFLIVVGLLFGYFSRESVFDGFWLLGILACGASGIFWAIYAWVRVDES